MTTPFFSIVIPTYNRASFIGQTIHSVLSQKFQNFEILIVDDGSTDITSQVVQSINNPKISYYKIENSERAAARNFGIEKAKGQYITFLDSDDLLKGDHLSTALEYIQYLQPDVFHLGYDVVTPKGEVIDKWKKLPRLVNNKLIEGNFLSCLGIFIKWTVLEKYRFNNDRNLSGSEDYELWLRLAAHYPILAFPHSTALLVNHESRSVISISQEALIKRIELLWYYLMSDKPFCEWYNDRLHKLYAFRDLYLALHLALIPGSKSKSAQYLMNSIKKFWRIAFNRRFWVVILKLITR